MVYDEPSISQSSIHGRNEPVDSVGRESEEVEVARLAANVAADDQRRAAGEREALGFRQAGDDLGNLFLQRAEHLRGETAALDPACPRLPNCGRQHELVPELEEPIGVDVEAHVVCGSLAQDLLVDAGPIAAVVEVIDQGWAAPTDVERQLDSAARLWQNRVVQVDGHGDGPRCGTTFTGSRLCHSERFSGYGRTAFATRRGEE